MRVRGPGLSDAVSGTDPLRDALPLRRAAPLDASPEAARTAALVNALSAAITDRLEAHPVNLARQRDGKVAMRGQRLRACVRACVLASRVLACVCVGRVAMRWQRLRVCVYVRGCVGGWVGACVRFHRQGGHARAETGRGDADQWEPAVREPAVLMGAGCAAGCAGAGCINGSRLCGRL